MASELEKQLKELEKSAKKGVLTDEEYQQRRAALIAGGAHPRVVAGKSGPLKWGFMGCLGIIGAIVVFVVVISILVSATTGGGDDDDDGTAASSGSGGDVHVALAVDSSGEIAAAGNGDKKSKVTILQIVDGAESTNQFLAPAEGRKYFAIEVLIENVGTKEVSSLDWKLRDSNDLELTREFVSGVGDNIDAFYSDLTPGGKKQGWVVFEIDAAATAKWIRADPNPFLKNDLYFDAQ